MLWANFVNGTVTETTNVDPDGRFLDMDWRPVPDGTLPGAYLDAEGELITREPDPTPAIPPVAELAPPPVTLIPMFEFRNRFTAAAEDRIRRFARGEAVEGMPEQAKPYAGQVGIFLSRTVDEPRIQNIDLSRKDVRQQLAVLVEIGLVSQDELDAVLDLKAEE